MIRIEADRLVRQPDEAAHEQAGADEQHDRQRDLGDDERLAQSLPSRIAVPRVGVLQRVVGPSALDCSAGASPKISAAAIVATSADGEDAAVDADLVDARNARRREREQQLARPRPR